MVFNNAIVSQTNSQKHLGGTLDLKLTFEEHLLNLFNDTHRKNCVLLSSIQEFIEIEARLLLAFSICL